MIREAGDCLEYLNVQNCDQDKRSGNGYHVTWRAPFPKRLRIVNCLLISRLVAVSCEEICFWVRGLCFAILLTSICLASVTPGDAGSNASASTSLDTPPLLHPTLKPTRRHTYQRLEDIVLRTSGLVRVKQIRRSRAREFKGALRWPARFPGRLG